MRHVFVGDIHGCLEPLERLLEASDFRPGRDRLLPVGDLVNKGPDSIGVLRRMIDLDAHSVLGNHDAEWLLAGRIRDPALASWLRAQPPARVLDDVILIHAGMHPAWTEADLRRLTDEQIDYAINVRYCDAQGRRPASDWPPPPAPFVPWDTFYSGRKRVVFGHWARRGLTRTERVIGLDSGCVYGRWLSAWIREEDRIVQVAARPD
jgi:bis(5'-nucleosyl)-tetraphosphatase (symmetrical)